MDFIMDALYMQSNVLSVRAHVYKMHDSLMMACGEGFPHLYPPGVFTMTSRSLASQKRVTEPWRLLLGLVNGSKVSENNGSKLRVFENLRESGAFFTKVGEQGSKCLNSKPEVLVVPHPIIPWVPITPPRHPQTAVRGPSWK